MAHNVATRLITVSPESLTYLNHIGCIKLHPNHCPIHILPSYGYHIQHILRQ